MMRPIISVLGSTKEGRFKDMKKLVDIVMDSNSNVSKGVFESMIIFMFN